MFETYEDDGVLDIAAGVQHDRALQVVKEIFATVRELASSGPTDAELAKARDRHLWSVEAMLDDAEGMAAFFGLAALANIARTPMARHAELAEASREDVRAAAETVFCGRGLSAVAVGMLSEADQKKIDRTLRSF